MLVRLLALEYGVLLKFLNFNWLFLPWICSTLNSTISYSFVFAESLNFLSLVSFHRYYQSLLHSLTPHFFLTVVVTPHFSHNILSSGLALTTVKPIAGELISGQNYQQTV